MSADGPSGVDATYAELMTIAGRHLRVATSQLATDAIATREDAGNAVSCHQELVHALGAQARVLVGPSVQTRAVLDSAHPDPVSLAAARFVQALETAVPRRPRQPELVSASSLARHYKYAAVAVRTATDLLLTQTDADGRLRTPDALRLLEPRGRIVAMDDVARLAVQLASTRQTLHEQVRAQGGYQRPLGVVPELAAVRDTAHDVQAVAARVLKDDPALLRITELQAVQHRLAALPVRSPDPLQEIRLRISRLRQMAWQMVGDAGAVPVSRQALAGFATVGVAVNTSAAVVGARLAGREVRDPNLPEALRSRLAKAEAWRSVLGGLRKLHTTAPPDRSVTVETNSILRLVARMVPAERGTGPLGRRELEPLVFTTLRDAGEALDQIAGWNSRSLSTAAAGGDLYLPGRLLTGDQVTDDPELVTAKLADRPVPAPNATVATVRDGYRAAATPAIALPSSPMAGPQRGIPPPEPPML